LVAENLRNSGWFLSFEIIQTTNDIFKERQNSPMHEILFQTPKPTATNERAEFYDLRIVKHNTAGELSALVREIRGWWDNESKQPFFDEPSLLESEPFPIEWKALDAYFQRRRALAGCGFVHVFNWHPVSGQPASHRRIDLATLAEER
jgi:hypothetical protein